MRPLLLTAVAVVTLAACDSGDPLDLPSAADVAGVYDVEQFRFVPDASALAPVNVLDTLVTDESFVEILDGGQATLRFRRTGGTTRIVPADVEVRRQQVRVRFQGGNEGTLGRLVLPTVLTFDRDGDDVLAAEDDLTADLTLYDSDRYSGFDSVPGTLTLRLRLRDGS